MVFFEGLRSTRIQLFNLYRSSFQQNWLSKNLESIRWVYRCNNCLRHILISTYEALVLKLLLHLLRDDLLLVIILEHASLSGRHYVTKSASLNVFLHLDRVMMMMMMIWYQLLLTFLLVRSLGTCRGSITCCVLLINTARCH